MYSPITDRDILSSHLSDESGLKGRADCLVRPGGTRDVVEIVKDCCGSQTPLLPIGKQTSTTGAAVPFGDLLMSLEKMAGVVDIDSAGMTATVLPGTITGDIKHLVEDEGLYYPPDPTSENECTIGGNFASNASGARSFQYGMTLDWVDGIELVDGKGDLHSFSRRKADKIALGPHCFSDSLTCVAGSEGILGIVTKLRLKLMPDPGPFIATKLFFRSLESALEAGLYFRMANSADRPRCVELFDEGAIEIVRGMEKPPQIPKGAKAMLFTEWLLGDRDATSVLEGLLPLFVRLKIMVDDTIVATTKKERTWFREIRHFVPSSLNRIAAKYHDEGGLKVATDFCVPVEQLRPTMDFVERLRQEHGIDFMVRYGHLGNGHPHVFMRGRTGAEVKTLRSIAHLMYEKAVSLGGNIAGEHGIGKTRREFLRYSYSSEMVEALKGLKKAFDPKWILARGNILPFQNG